MNDPQSESIGKTSVDAAIAEWYEEIDRGQSPDVDAFVARHSDCERELREFIADYYHLQQFADSQVSSHLPTGSSTPSAELIAGEGTKLETPHAMGNDVPECIKHGAFEVLHEIARGGMGVVFKGRDKNLRREVAIKVLLEHRTGDEQLKQRFLEEAQIAGQLQHPGITPVYELGEFSDRRPYFAMKLVKGETLAALLAQRSNPHDDRPRFLKIFEQVCQTLAYAHSRNVIHRDLKPANIMVGAFGEVQVMDWGLAKVLSTGGNSEEHPHNVSVIQTARSDGPETATDSKSRTQAGSVLGTLSYMPPEQALGNISQLDRRADVFAMGAILCEILTGRPPYLGNSVEQLRRKAARAELTEAYECLERCGADSELVGLARHALAPEPENRPADAGELASRMASYREGVEARLRQAELAEAEATTRAIAERSRRKLTLVFSGVVLTVLAIGATGTMLGLIQTGQAKDRLRQELYVADLQLAHQMWESSHGTAKNVSELLSRQIPAKDQTDLRDFAWRLQWTEINRNSLVLKGHRHGANLAAFTADGQLVTLDGDLTLRRWKSSGTLLSELPLKGVSQVCSWSISADGRQIALGTSNSVHVIDTGTGQTLQDFAGKARSRGLGFSADGRLLATAWDDGRIQIWQIATGQETALLLAKSPDQIDWLEQLALAPDGRRLLLIDYPDIGLITQMKVGQAESVVPSEHRSALLCVALAPDGNVRATGDSNGYVCLSDDASVEAEQSPLLRSHRGSVSALRFSSSGGQLATGGADGTVSIWDVARREQIKSFKGHQGRIRALSFAPDGLAVVSASEDGTCRIWDLRPGRTAGELGHRERPVFSMAYSTDGKRLAVGTGSGVAAPDGFVEIWDVASGQLLKKFRATEGRVLALAYASDNHQIVTGGYDSHVRVWDETTGRELTGDTLPDMRRLEANPPQNFRQSAIGSLAVSPNGKFVVAGFGHPTFHQPDYDQVAMVWELDTGKEVAVLSGHTNSVCDVAFSRNGQLLATACDDHHVRLWSTQSWMPIGRPLKGGERIKSVTFSIDGRWVVAGDSSGVVTVWDTASGTLVNQLRGHADAVQRLVFSPDGRTLATASWDNTIKLWDPVSFRETRTLRGHDDWISCLAFAPDSNTLATGSFDATVRLWKAEPLPKISAIVAEDRAAAHREKTQSHGPPK